MKKYNTEETIELIKKRLKENDDNCVILRPIMAFDDVDFDIISEYFGATSIDSYTITDKIVIDNITRSSNSELIQYVTSLPILNTYYSSPNIYTIWENDKGDNVRYSAYNGIPSVSYHSKDDEGKEIYKKILTVNEVLKIMGKNVDDNIKNIITNPNLKTLVVHSETKNSWNVINKKIGSKEEIATIPYFYTGNDQLSNMNKEEALIHAKFISTCFNNSNKICEMLNN